MTDFCHIIPTNYLPLLRDVSPSKSDLLLAHVAEESKYYRQYYNQRPLLPGGVRILDNGVFELNKKGIEFDAHKLLDIAHEVNATHIVLPDYPNEPGIKTFESAKKWSEHFAKLDSNMKFMFVPQSKIGDLVDYVKCWEYGIALHMYGYIDYIALSILGTPNAYNSTKKFQRYSVRQHFLANLCTLSPNVSEYLNGSKMNIHMLGLLDGPREVEMCLREAYMNNYNIATWDSSAAAWAGIHQIEFDGSITGLQDGKFEKEVDFDYPLTTFLNSTTGTQTNLTIAKRNIAFIDQQCKKYS